MRTTKLPKTPLQRLVGFEVAEETYDMLPFTAQIILDLKIEGWNDSDIARALGIPRVTCIDTFRRARYFLANSNIKRILETRVFYRETHSSVIDDSGPMDGWISNTTQFGTGHMPSRDDE